MRLSKKLLAALLPITATSTLVPVLTSCNKGNGYSINYGDEINCLDEQATNYHSLDDVKNAVKNHVAIEQAPTMGLVEFIELTNGEMAKQKAYFDLIATLAISCNFKFHLTYSKETRTGTLKYVEDGQEISVDETYPNWTVDGVPEIGKPLPIYMTFSPLGGGQQFKKISYMYQNTKLLAED